MDYNERAIVLLSGGIDSAVCLWLAKEKGWEVYALSFNYYRRQEREKKAAAELAQAADVLEHRTLEIPFLSEFEDTLFDTESPLYKQKAMIPREYIPSRNLVFYSIASSWAEVIGATKIVGGHHKGDLELFPDATPEFLGLLNRAFALGGRVSTIAEIKCIAPLHGKDKTEVLSEAIRLRVPLQMTWSCQRREDVGCGQCTACLSRLKSFHELGVNDPIRYLGESSRQVQRADFLEEPLKE